MVPLQVDEPQVSRVEQMSTWLDQVHQVASAQWAEQAAVKQVFASRTTLEAHLLEAVDRWEPCPR